MSRYRTYVVVSDPRDGQAIPPEMLVPVDRFLEGGGDLAQPRSLVVNLCRTTRYGSRGYYVSLLADARGQYVIPTVETSEQMAEPYGVLKALQKLGIPTVEGGIPAAVSPRDPELLETISSLKRVVTNHRMVASKERAGLPVEVLVILGVCRDQRFSRIATSVFRELPAPLLRVRVLSQDDEWKVLHVEMVSPHLLDDGERTALAELLLNRPATLRHAISPAHQNGGISLAVLVDPSDPFSPSSPETIDRLERVAMQMNVHVHRIGLGDLRKLPEYDALFIRVLTGVSEPAFQFALRAEALDMPVVDDSQSIIRCGNKVFLEELLRREGIPTPRTLVVTRNMPWEQVAALGLPLVVKLPDGSFSAVHKIAASDDFRRRAEEMFERSPLIIAQEFLPTEYDWRVTVLGGRLLFAARYYMARGHWQIRTEVKGTERYGRVEAVPRDEAPSAVVETALRAASLIGDGLYGVDLKETPNGPVVIDISDNPNLDVGYEDAEDGNTIYEDIVRFFLKQVEGDSRLPDVRRRRSFSEAALESIRRPLPVKGSRRDGGKAYRAFEVAGMELEYSTVDRDLNVVSLVEPAFRVLAGRGTSDVELGALGFSNEIADHVFEVKTTSPMRSLRQAEEVLYEGVERFSAILRDAFDARLLPTGMHPWFDPRRGRLWTRSGGRIYGTYARLFDVKTHGWMNVQASHLNLPFSSERETMAIHTAAALLIPYLPAIAASTPIHDGVLQPNVDSRLSRVLEGQVRIPEIGGQFVPEYVSSFSEYRAKILGPMYASLDLLTEDAAPIRHEFLNARGAVLKFSRRALEVRVLDTQECVKMDVAIAAFVRAALKDLTKRVLAGKMELPPHDLLVQDFLATMREGSAAWVAAPHIVRGRKTAPVEVRAVLRQVLAGARRFARKEEHPYLDLVAEVIEQGSLSERIRAALIPHQKESDEKLTVAIRSVYIELMDCLVANEPWRGRAA